MIAYKNFRLRKGKLYPWHWRTFEIFNHYPKGYIITRADGCGPFACWPDKRIAKDWCMTPWGVTHRVRIKESKDRSLWMGKVRRGAPGRTIFADEFEILERVG